MPSPSPAVVISICALAFTVSSFWWINARPGRLRVTAPRVFSCYVRADKSSLRFPVTLYNTGAVPLVVADLRLRLSSAGTEVVAASKTFRKSVSPEQDDFLDFPHPYVVTGRSVVITFVEFAVEPAVMATGQRADVTVEALFDGHGWKRVGAFELRTDTVTDPGVYISYSNDPAHWRPEQLDRAEVALAAVRATLN